MTKNGSNLNINVLSGLVQVDRVREPGKPRSLSVRVFGIPFFERGVGAINSFARKPESKPVGGSGNRGGEEEDELPLDP